MRGKSNNNQKHLKPSTRHVVKGAVWTSKISRHDGPATAENTLPTPILAASAATSPDLEWKPALSHGDSCKCHSTDPRPVQSIAFLVNQD